MKSFHYPLIVLALLVVAALACGGDNAGRQVGTAPQETAAPPQVTVYHVGDVIQVEEHTIVLNDAGFQAGVLRANFTIENKGGQEIAVSSTIDFSARDADGTNLEQDFGCSSLGGEVLPGDRLRGDVCWKTQPGPVRLYYEASLFGSGAVVWEVGP